MEKLTNAWKEKLLKAINPGAQIMGRPLKNLLEACWRSAGLLEPEEDDQVYCEWKDESHEDHQHGWETKCGKHFGFGLYPPIREIIYCPNCGKTIKMISEEDALAKARIQREHMEYSLAMTSYEQAVAERDKKIEELEAALKEEGDATDKYWSENIDLNAEIDRLRKKIEEQGGRLRDLEAKATWFESKCEIQEENHRAEIARLKATTWTAELADEYGSYMWDMCELENYCAKSATEWFASRRDEKVAKG